MSEESTFLKANLGGLVEQFDAISFDAIMQVAELIKGYAKIYVHVETGSLRDSIRIERGGEGKYWREIRVRAGGYIVNPKTGRLVDYASVIEWRFPYMMPAVEQARPELVLLLKSNLEAIKGVEYVSIEGQNVTAYVKVDTEQAQTEITNLRSSASQTARILRRLSGSEKIDVLIGKLQQATITAYALQAAIAAVRTVSMGDPLSMAVTAISVGIAAISVDQLLQRPNY